jgi:hypothetical protein
MGAYASPPPLTGRGGDAVWQWHAPSHRCLALACARLGVGAVGFHCDPPPCRVEALPPSPRSGLHGEGSDGRFGRWLVSGRGGGGNGEEGEPAVNE